MEYNRRIQKARQEFSTTLECQDDAWGLYDEHYRFVNCRDEKGNLIPRLDPETKEQIVNDDKPKYEKRLELIGRPHIKWEDHFVQVRIDKDNSKWFKHWPVAAELFLIGKLNQNEKSWVIEEGATRFQKGMIPLKNVEGKQTRAIQALLKLGVVKAINGQVVLASEAEAIDEKEASQAATEMVSSQPVLVTTKDE
jgi:hypothetical protein